MHADSDICFAVMCIVVTFAFVAIRIWGPEDSDERVETLQAKLNQMTDELETAGDALELAMADTARIREQRDNALRELCAYQAMLARERQAHGDDLELSNIANWPVIAFPTHTPEAN